MMGVASILNQALSLAALKYELSGLHVYVGTGAVPSAPQWQSETHPWCVGYKSQIIALCNMAGLLSSGSGLPSQGKICP